MREAINGRVYVLEKGRNRERSSLKSQGKGIEEEGRGKAKESLQGYVRVLIIWVSESFEERNVKEETRKRREETEKDGEKK